MTNRQMESPLPRMTPAEKRVVTSAATLLNCDQVAEVLGMQRNTIYMYVKTGKLAAIRINGKIRFRRDYIEGIIGGTI